MGDLPTDKIISCFYGSSKECVKVVDASGTLMSFNPNGLVAMEIDDERDVIGKQWLDFWNGNMRAKAEAAFVTAKQGTLSYFEGYCPTFKGTMKYWEVSIAPLYDDMSGIQWLLVSSRDATAQKNLEKRVEAQSLEIKDLKEKLISLAAV